MYPKRSSGCDSACVFFLKKKSWEEKNHVKETSGEQGDGIGIYVAFSNLEQEAESAPYSITVNEQGQAVLTLTADDGTISWVKLAAE